MKKRKIIVGFVLIAFLVGCGVATYEKSVQIDLGSGMIREVQKSLWITIHRSSPKQTRISHALGGSIQPIRWLTVDERWFLLPGTRRHPYYARILQRFGVIDREFAQFDSDELSTMTARLTLQELEKTENPRLVNAHLEKFHFALMESVAASMDDSDSDPEISRIWQNILTEQDAP